MNKIVLGRTCRLRTVIMCSQGNKDRLTNLKIQNKATHYVECNGEIGSRTMKDRRKQENTLKSYGLYNSDLIQDMLSSKKTKEFHKKHL